MVAKSHGPPSRVEGVSSIGVEGLGKGLGLRDLGLRGKGI